MTAIRLDFLFCINTVLLTALPLCSIYKKKTYLIINQVVALQSLLSQRIESQVVNISGRLKECIILFH